MSRRKLLLLSVVAWVLVATAAIAAEPVRKRLVHVRVPNDEILAALVNAGFDIAGMNKRDRTAGVVATEDEIRRLTDLGFGFTLGPSNDDPVTIQALQDYTDPAELSAFISQTAAAYPNLVRTRVLSTNLFEGHQQVAVRITKDPDLPNDRPVFVLDSQHHAREVMTPEIAKDMIEYLTSRYGTDPAVTRWVDNIEIWVVASVNPDGAAYVFSGDNMWRRNRRPSCPVDVNRNYPVAWGTCNGSSGSCTDDTNRGSEPASEPETQGMLGLAADTRPFYALSYHTYGEYIMYSYGCTNPDEMTAMQEVAQSLNGILQDDNGATNSYTVGPIWSAIYLVDGGSVDTWYNQYGTYAFTIEASCCSFQPDYATWRNVTVQRQRVAWQFFLNRTLDAPQIRGKITNAATGQPVPARVDVQEVVFTHGESPRRADARGLYHWLARAGQSYHLTYSQAGYCTLQRTVTVGSGPATEDVSMAQPTPPSSVSAVGNGDHRIDVSWSAAVNATKYRVLRSLDSGGPYQEVALVDAPATTFSDTTVSGGVPYYYVVRALQPCESAASTEASAQTTGACTVGPAFGGVASVTNPGLTTCSLQLDWAAASTRCGGAVSYDVYRSATAPFVPSVSNRIAAGWTGTSYTDHDALVDGSAYHYVVRAVDAGNLADDGNVVTRSATTTGPSTVGTWTDDAGDSGSAKLTPVAPWSVQATGGKTSPKVYATGIYTNNLCAALTSPSISVQATSVLRFASKYDIEAGWDAAIVEVAEGPTFATWSRLTSVNYPDSLSNTGNACGFPKTFAGTVFSRQYTTPVYPATDWNGSLAAFAGKEIRLRWRIGSDSTGTGKGFWVDDVAVTDAVFRQTCTTGAASSPGEPATLTASRGAGTSIDVGFTPACGVSDHVAYWGTGPIAGAVTWTAAACGLGTTGAASFDPGDPPSGSFLYFVVVGQDATREGSYGAGSAGERAEAVAVGSCDRGQVLGGGCP
jgi:hypothetical protein